MFEHPGLLLLAVFPLCMIFATFFDLFTMKIPNWLNLTLVGGFFIAAVFGGVPLSVITIHVMLATIIFLVGYGLFLLRVLGGGDVKLLAASSLWFGPVLMGKFALVFSLLGGGFAILVWASRRMPLPAGLEQVGWVSRLHKAGGPIPYGVALGPAALYVFPDTGWMNLLTGNAF